MIFFSLFFKNISFVFVEIGKIQIIDINTLDFSVCVILVIIRVLCQILSRMILILVEEAKLLFWNLSPSPSLTSSSGSRPLSSREIADTLGALVRSQIPSLISRSLISHENIPGLSRLYSSILASTSGVATRGLLPPMTPGLMLPVSW